ncbi:MAG: single-stranded DNA-binding protein [Clostridia bacterium]|nr:single-stranded DNA-binding protein [Clostridia bacterium]
MLNKVILTGRLTAAPDLKKTSSGVAVTAFTLAVQRQYKDSAGNYPTDFINCVAWRNTAEFICKHFDKGNMISVVWELNSRKYEDKQGNKRVAIEVVCNEAHFAESKKIDPAFKKPADVTAEDLEEIDDDDLPF